MFVYTMARSLEKEYTDGINGEKHNVLRDTGSDARKAVNAEGCAIRIPNFPIVAHFQLVVLVRGRESLVVDDCAIGILQTKYCRYIRIIVSNRKK